MKVVLHFYRSEKATAFLNVYKRAKRRVQTVTAGEEEDQKNRRNQASSSQPIVQK